MARAFETLRIERDGTLAIITLDRPDQLNAVNTPMIKDLIAVFDVTDRDDDIRAVIMTGAGRAGLGGAHPPDALAHAHGRSSHGGPSHRQPRHPGAWGIR